MAKIGTAHVEVKPVLNHEALAQIGNQIESEVAAAVSRGLKVKHPEDALVEVIDIIAIAAFTDEHARYLQLLEDGLQPNAEDEWHLGRVDVVIEDLKAAGYLRM